MIRKWKKGDPFEASHLNEPIEALTRLETPDIAPPYNALSGKYQSPELRRFRIKSIQADYLTCRTWDGTAEGSNDVFVAKSYLLRNAITSRSGITYTYTSTTERTANGGSNTETQVVVPSFAVDDEIFAVPVPEGGTGVQDGSSNEILFLDINSDGRAWAKKAGT